MDQSKRILELTERNEALERQIKRLRSSSLKTDANKESFSRDKSPFCEQTLSNHHIERYSRQLLLSNGFGVKGQHKLLESSVLVIGAGGIGSTVILYLAASGIGKLTIVDFDTIDVSNLHRQVIHKSNDVGQNKAESAANAVASLNPTISCETVKEPLTSDNALALVSRHCVVVDASDNPQTRYLVNDACVLAGVPLVSGSAIGIEGQLTVYNYQGGPCYRCLYPKPNIKEGSKSCSDSGVLGPVPGLIGALQSVEAIKVLTGVGQVMVNHLLVYDALQCSFIRIKKPPRQPKCNVCGPNASIQSMEASAQACSMARGPTCAVGTSLAENGSKDVDECSAMDYDKVRLSGEPHILLDVRVPEQIDLCALPGAVNIPMKELEQRIEEVENLSDGFKPVYCVCRRGIFSLAATQIIKSKFGSHPKIASVINIKGGLDAWRRDVDPAFPKY